MRKYYIIGFVLILASCRNKGQVEEYNGRRYSIKVAKDTVKANEMVKAIIYLAAPYSVSSETKIVAFLETNEHPIKNNLDSLDYIPKLGFHNLEYDEENQKWASENLEYRLTSAIGKRFSTLGENYLRGYILEYYKGDPLLDSLFDYTKTRIHLFEQKVFIVE